MNLVFQITTRALSRQNQLSLLEVPKNITELFSLQKNRQKRKGLGLQRQTSNFEKKIGICRNTGNGTLGELSGNEQILKGW